MAIAGLIVLVLVGGGTVAYRQWRGQQMAHEATVTVPAGTGSPRGPNAAEYDAVTRVAAPVSASVAAITVVGCGDQKNFNGVVVGPDLVATADQLLDDTAAVSVSIDGRSYATTIVGRDPISGVGLVRTTRPIAATPASFASTALRVGQAAGGVGPAGGSSTVETGWISALGQRYSIGASSHSDTLEIRMVTDPPVSGSPLIDASGQLVALVTGYKTSDRTLAVALPGGPIAAALARLAANTQAIRPTLTCDTPLGPSGKAADPGITIPSTAGDITGSLALGSRATALADPLTIYFRGINQGRYDESLAVMSPSLLGQMTLADFTEGTRTSFDSEFRVTALRADAGGFVVSLEFKSLQDPSKGPDGQACNRWTIDYGLIPAGGRYLIDSATGTGGGSPFRDC